MSRWRHFPPNRLKSSIRLHGVRGQNTAISSDKLGRIFDKLPVFVFCIHEAVSVVVMVETLERLFCVEHTRTQKKESPYPKDLPKLTARCKDALENFIVAQMLQGPSSLEVHIVKHPNTALNRQLVHFRPPPIFRTSTLLLYPVLQSPPFFPGPFHNMLSTYGHPTPPRWINTFQIFLKTSKDVRSNIHTMRY